MNLLFAGLAKPLGLLLQALYSVIGNYGISLIVMTTVIKLAMYPVYKQQTLSQIGMQRLQPKMRDIQNKYSGDRNLMNQKLQELYQEEGVSPTAGCLPMIVQMIILFGLFALLRDPIQYMNNEKMVFAIHESFLWIEDLAQPDPWILPILAGVATFFAFALSSASTSQAGAMGNTMTIMMKYIFPIMIAWLARSYPAGLALYWFVSQFLQIFFSIRFNQLKKNEDEKRNAKKKKRPVRAGGGER